MAGSPGHPEQVAGVHLDGYHRSFRGVDVEKPAPFDDEAHLVLVVPVLDVELVEHRVEVRGSGIDVDDVGGDVAAFLFELLDLGAVGLEDLLGRRVRGHGMGRLPALVVDAEAGEIRGDLLFVLYLPVLIGNRQDGHCRCSPWCRGEPDRHPSFAGACRGARAPLHL